MRISDWSSDVCSSDLGLDAAWLAEIDAAGQFTHDHDVEAADDVGLQRAGLDQRVEAFRRTQVGEQVHFLAQAQQAALGLLVEGQVVPLRATDSAQDRKSTRLNSSH